MLFSHRVLRFIPRKWNIKSLLRPSITKKITVGARNLSTSPPIIARNLFDVKDNLSKPTDFIERSKDSIHRINFLRSYLLENYQYLSHSEQLRLFDSISSELCNVIDAADLCRNIHTDVTFQQSAENCFTMLSNLIIDLNTDVRLYDRLEALLQSSEVQEIPVISSQKETSLTPDEYYFAKDLYTEFRSEGIHLIKQKLSSNTKTNPTIKNQQDVMKQMQQEIIETETIFSGNIRQASILSAQESMIKIGPYDLRDSSQYTEYRSLGSWLQQQIERSSNRQHRNKVLIEDHGKGYLYCPPHRNLLASLLSSSQEETIRQMIWCEQLFQPITNLPVYSKLLQQRQQLSKVLSYTSYSDKILRKSIYQSAGEVQAMLKVLSENVKERTMTELAQLSELKRQFTSPMTAEGQQQQSLGDQQRLPGLQVWDLPYYQYLHRQLIPMNPSEAHTDTTPVISPEDIKPYFALSDCLESLQMISREVYGVEMIEEQALDPQELWIPASSSSSFSATAKITNLFSNNLFSPDSSKNTVSPPPGIKKYRIYDTERQVPIGTVYFDCFAREGKFPGSAHFTVRCGCDRLQWQDFSSNTQTRRFSEVFTIEKQLPVVVLVFPWHVSRSEPTKLLSLTELEGLYHEWGHALHSLFSQTPFQHLSGTRGSTDYIEIPSHFMEYFARDPQVIQKWAKHYQSRQSIPLELLQTALQQRDRFLGLDLQNQILYSAVDQYLFSTDVSWQEMSPQQVFTRSLEAAAQIQQEYTLLPLASRQSFTSEMIHANPETQELKQSILSQVSVEGLPNIGLFNHNHFITYGGSYYSYLLARLYAAQIWSKLFAKDPLNRAAGKIFREEMLAYGGAKPPKQILDQLVGTNVDPAYFIQLNIK